MTSRISRIVLLAVAVAATGCDHTPTPTATVAPSPVPSAGPAPVTPHLIEFTDAVTRFSTTDVRDGHEHIIQFNSANELIWTADGTHLPGYPLAGPLEITATALCACGLEVRFSSKDGERRAYLTADYGHSNPATLVDLDLVGGVLTFAQSSVYPPGTYTLSGTITELTSAGPVPIEGATVYRVYGGGWQDATTDRSGFYEIHGLYDLTSDVEVHKPGFETLKTTLTTQGDTRFDVRLVRSVSTTAGQPGARSVR